MKRSFPSVPWNTLDLWREANACLATTMLRNVSSMADLLSLTGRIRQQLEALFPIMDELCRVTCPNCTDSCCQRAWVWADFKDLLFFHLADIAIPSQQLLSQQGDDCHYASAEGCRLERIQRPFVCTWYLCPDQSACLKKQPEKMLVVSDALQEIKTLRKKMETAFIKALV